MSSARTDPDHRRKVVQWGTGEIGRRALELIIGHPGLELAGVLVHDPAKEGRDAADLCGLATPTGIMATCDINALLDARPDAICYNAMGTGAAGRDRSAAAVDDFCTILRRGINLVSTAVTPLVYPPTAPAHWRAAIDAACREGGASCFVTGTHPGFVTDLLPLTMTGLTGRIDALTIWEIISYENWTKPDKLRDHFGMGRSESELPALFEPGVVRRIYGSVMDMVADQLDLPIDRVEERQASWFTPAEMPSCAGLLPMGTRAAIRFGLHGMVAGREILALDHIYRAHPSAAPEWRQPPGSGGYALEISGDPNWTVDFGFADETGDALRAGQKVTAVRVVNSLLAVCDAQPGLLLPTDLPVISGRGLFYPPMQRI